MFVEYIKAMHNKFGISCENIQFSQEEKNFRVSAMLEEVSEYLTSKTQEDELDALVDLVVFAFGTAERQGYLPLFKRAFCAVMEANMAKELGPNQKRGSFALDLVKPKDWQPANLSKLFDNQKDLFEKMDELNEKLKEKYPCDLYKNRDFVAPGKQPTCED